ncbi:alternative ribosome rescue aminoacyl-tRNA hydrolase ArfB [Christiangramia forsetii]|uniref:Protein containing peptidyl-tRNA hydrolase domain n=2 Tax=Christiangramia forsetii TaxID=411153 RepID=A0M5V5_CHRFK|nr:alternative ribosome rescue aminoacyl-tRNA hydrolase ArfB [Christiangramia forsetii]GGG32076.1 aminoacyl-tRNA hydrolase [Christiangramia forsetii]CAL68000.1 protein containing peptidyl-tRNA hydrolase domain [Christiangramia forsetii KT0803]
MDEEFVLTELDYKAVRSSGPGGQHANKTATKVELSFDVENSQALSDQEKKRIFNKLSGRINKEGILKMNSEDSRSQHTNKDIVTQNFLFEIKEVLKKPKRRKKTKPTRASKIKRLKAKKKKSEIKANRKDPLK